MKVVINACFGRFSLSPRAIKRLAELNGRECYFFTNARKSVSLEELESSPTLFFSAFDIPNPNEVVGQSFKDEDGRYRKYNDLYEKHNLDSRPADRTDPKLIQVIEELGSGHRTGASGSCAKLKIVEIPDGTEYEIDEYDGRESVHGVHQSWS